MTNEEILEKTLEIIKEKQKEIKGVSWFNLPEEITDGLNEQLYGEDEYLMWGDCGIANFFIDPEDLKKCDFSKVVYNWDCC